MLPPLALDEPLLAPDAAQRLLRERQAEVALHPRSAPRGQAPLERDGPPPLSAGDALSRVERRAAPVCEPSERAGLPAPEPLAHRLDGRAELPGRGLDAVLAGEAHQFEAQVSRLCRSAQHGVIYERTHRVGDLLFLLAHEESVTADGMSTFLAHRFNHSFTQPRTSDSPDGPKMESLRRGVPCLFRLPDTA